MKKRNLYKPILFVCIIASTFGCSPKKNTALSRNYQSFVTQFNIQFNGRESYNEGIVAIQKGNKDDYSTLLTMYPISHPDNTKLATAQLDKTIEKSRKAIKTRSIKKKPKRDAKRWSDSKYRSFYEQNEFNSALKEAWMLLAKSEFHKGDFLGSVGTFSYISRHYTSDVDIVTQCQLWIARAYLEMGWDYEAEQLISKLNQDNINFRVSGLFAAVNAQLYLETEQYAKAIPFLEMALEKEKSKYQKQRFAFILGQLYKKQGNKKKASDYFSKVIGMNPPYEMSFYARINRMELSSDYAGTRKQLKRMMKNINNEDFLDQLYFVYGNTYLAQKDTVKAIEQYHLAAEKSTRNGIDKAIVLIKTGDLYYEQKKYVEAQPPYDEASKILSIENNDYQRVAHRSEILGELVVQYNIVTLQDSLLHLSTLTPEQQLAIVTDLIAKKKAEEEAAAEKEADNLNKEQERASRRDLASTMMPLGSGDAGNWYFYNQSLIKSGKTEFQKKWGNRKLEDNWRRGNKAQSLFAEESTTPLDTLSDVATTENKTEVKAKTESADPNSPDFYLNQIPSTKEEKQLANVQIAKGLFEMGLVYKDKIGDVQMAMKTFNEFTSRFGSDEKVPDALFQQFIMLLKDSNFVQADLFRAKILADYPNSKYAEILANPDYIAQQHKMYAEQDSIYRLTYSAYSKNDFAAVYRNESYMKRNYPQSTLLPKFAFLSALSVGKTEPRDSFAVKLNGLVSAYPANDVSTMAKDILALMNQGRENQMGTSHGSLITLREETLRQDEAANEASNVKVYSSDKVGKHRLLILSNADKSALNELMYQIASYNFSRFMIKDFDLVFTPLDSSRTILSVTNLETYDEAKWYEKALQTDSTLSTLLTNVNSELIVMSENNFALFRSGKSLNEYLAFENTLAKTKATKSVAQKPQEKVEIKVVDIPKPDTSADSLVAQSASGTSEGVPSGKVAEPEAPLYKNLFAIQPNAPHYVALYLLSGSADFEKLKQTFNDYNTENYGQINLNVSLETVDGKQVVLIGSFPDSKVARFYLLDIVKEKSLFDGLKGANYRNLMGTQRNLNTMVEKNALNDYFDFMQEFYTEAREPANYKAKENKTAQKPATQNTKNTEEPKVATVPAKTSEKSEEQPAANVSVPKPNVEVATPKPVDNKVAETPKPTATTNAKTEDKAKPATQAPKQEEKPTAPKPEEKTVVVPEAPMYKNLFAIEPNALHFVALYLLSGSADFVKLKSAFDAYNIENYSLINLNVSLETINGKQIVMIGSFPDSQVAKSYLLRIVKEKTLFEGLKGTNYRNLMGTQRNLNTMIQSNGLDTYFDFMQEFYLK